MINTALIGCGRMGKMYAKVIANHPDANFVALCDVNREAADETARIYKVPNVVYDYQDIAKMKDVDAVVIISSTNMHKAMITEMARAGKAIFCEKPLTVSMPDTMEVIDILEETKVRFFMGFMRRYDSGYAEAKRLIEDGAIGDPVLIKAISRDPVAPPYEYAKPEVSGDTIMDLSVHDIDVCMWLMGSKIKTIFAQKRVLVHDFLKEINASDTVLSYMEFENGTIGYVEGSRYSIGGYDVRCEILGAKGCIQVGYYRDKPVVLFNKEGRHYECVPWFVERFQNAYEAQLRVFLDCMESGAPMPVTQYDGLYAQKVAVAAEKSCISRVPENVV